MAFAATFRKFDRLCAASNVLAESQIRGESQIFFALPRQGHFRVACEFLYFSPLALGSSDAARLPVFQATIAKADIFDLFISAEGPMHGPSCIEDVADLTELTFGQNAVAVRHQVDALQVDSGLADP